jgi:DNA-directed RNA polymerase specialized sigma subunit
MEGPISKSVVERLPSVIKNLNEACQKTYIYLRLRKSENEISRQLKLPIEETVKNIETVRNELIRAGQIDLIENPQFISIHSEDPDTPDMPLSTEELDIDKRLIIKEFLSYLKEAVNELPEHQSRLLRLRYRHRMSAKDIVGFCKEMGFSLIPDKKVTELKEHDIFYALNTTLREVFKRLKKHYTEEKSFGLDNLKYIFEEIGI